MPPSIWIEWTTKRWTTTRWKLPLGKIIRPVAGWSGVVGWFVVYFSGQAFKEKASIKQYCSERLLNRQCMSLWDESSVVYERRSTFREQWNRIQQQQSSEATRNSNLIVTLLSMHFVRATIQSKLDITGLVITTMWSVHFFCQSRHLHLICVFRAPTHRPTS